MHWNQGNEEERAALMRLVALLCSLAHLAERAAFRPALTRCFVLWLLRIAERAAYDLVAGEDAHLLVLEPAGYGLEDAIHLAESLLALAFYLDAEARLIAGGTRETLPLSLEDCAGPRAVGTVLILAFGARGKIPDTS